MHACGDVVIRMKEQFESSDSDSDQVLSPDEFRLFLRSLKIQLSDDEIDAVMAAADTNSDGVIVRHTTPLPLLCQP